MKILHVVEPFSSGIVTFIIHLTREIEEMNHVVLHGNRASQDNIDAVRSRFPDYVKFENWKYAGREINLINDLLALIELIKFYKRIKPDVIHLHSSKAGFLGRVAGMFTQSKIIYTPNGASFLRRDVSVFKRGLFKILEKFANFISGDLICCSKSEKSAFDQIGVRGNYVNNGVKITSVEKVSSKKLRIACFALLTPQKNPQAFAEIANYFANDNSIEFYWVGDGDRSLLLSDNIKVTGWLGANEVAEQYRLIDIYLSTSLWEGLPFSVMEAMNAQACLLLSNCVGNVDLVKEEGYNGYVYNGVQEAIKKLDEIKDNKEKIKCMGQNSRKFLIENFNAAKNMKQYEAFYRH